MEKRVCFAVFGSTNSVLKAEKVFKKNNIPFKLMPTPKQLAPYCDISITFSESRIKDVKDMLNNANIRVKGYYIKNGEEYVEV
ncbi:MAG: hypothetical protein A2073_02465 [Deltaproteobacteria bacterium GWC2_42_11]|nr:MAG: hypothetical protein A2073_02465 [Deltaproteobacteria bacterium GWC2_42_11]